MTVEQLKEKLKDLPHNMEVFIEKSVGEYSHQLVEFAGVKNLRFFDDDLEAWDDVFVISDDFLNETGPVRP